MSEIIRRNGVTYEKVENLTKEQLLVLIERVKEGKVSLFASVENIRSSRKKWNKSDDLLVVEKSNKGATIQEIADALNRSKKAICQHIFVLRKQGYDIKPRDPHPKWVTDPRSRHHSDRNSLWYKNLSPEKRKEVDERNSFLKKLRKNLK